MTNDQLEQLEALANAATPGPWENAEDAVFRVTVEAGDRWVCDCISGRVHSLQEAKDAAYIAAANPATVLELIAELRELRRIAALHDFKALYDFGRALARAAESRRQRQGAAST